MTRKIKSSNGGCSTPIAKYRKKGVLFAFGFTSLLLFVLIFNTLAKEHQVRSYADSKETHPKFHAVKLNKGNGCSAKTFPQTTLDSSCYSTNQVEANLQRRSLTLWSKAREKLPTLHLQNIEMQSNEEDLGSSVERHMTIKLRVCIFAILVYLSIGVAAYSYVFENWGIVDSLYFTVVTFTTVGYGDLFPSTEVAKLFTSFYSLVGVSILGVALGVIGSRVVEYEKRMILRVNEVVSAFRMIVVKHREKKGRAIGTPPAKNNVVSVLLKACAPVFAVLFVGSFFIVWAEGWGWMNAFYFCTVTAVTVGYGDNVHSTKLMRFFAVLYIPILVGVMSNFFGTVARLIMDAKRNALLHHMSNRELKAKDLIDMDSDDDGIVTEAEFIVFMLSKMHEVDNSLLEKLRGHFRRLDTDNSGALVIPHLYEDGLRCSKKQTGRRVKARKFFFHNLCKEVFEYFTFC